MIFRRCRVALAVALLGAQLAPWGIAAEPSEALSHFKIFSHDARVLADRSWDRLESGAPLPWQEDPSTLFYLQPQGTEWLQESASELSAALTAVQSPGLDFSGQANLDDARLAALLKSLRTTAPLRLLRLDGTAVTNQSIPLINQFTKLQVLTVSPAMTDQALAQLSLPRLRELSLASSRITDQGMTFLSRCKTLRSLDLSGTRVGPAGLALLPRLALDQLRLGDKITDEAARSIVRFRALGQLDISQTRMTDASLPRLATLPVLHSLFLPKQITDSGLQSVRKMTHLKRLDLSQSGITDTGLGAIGSLTGLEELSLAGTEISDAGVASLMPLRNLRTLDVSGTRLTTAGIERLGSLEGLQVLSFTSDGKMRFKDLRLLKSLQKLRTVLINGRPISFSVVAFVKSTGISGGGTALGYTSKGQAPWPDETPIESLPTERLINRRSGLGVGLQRIHQVESELDHVIPAVETAHIDVSQDTQENFLGEFEVHSVGHKPVAR